MRELQEQLHHQGQHAVPAAAATAPGAVAAVTPAGAAVKLQ